MLRCVHVCVCLSGHWCMGVCGHICGCVLRHTVPDPPRTPHRAPWGLVPASLSGCMCPVPLRESFLCVPLRQCVLFPQLLVALFSSPFCFSVPPSVTTHSSLLFSWNLTSLFIHSLTHALFGRLSGSHELEPCQVLGEGGQPRHKFTFPEPTGVWEKDSVKQ